MEQQTMQKIIVIGSPGSGKSVFSRALQKKTGLPLWHLDNLYWNADRTHVEKPVFLARLQKVIRQSQWIIDGNYSSSIPLRLAACDTVILLDYPPEVCLAGIAQRRGKVRPDIPWIEEEADEEFLRYARTFRQEQIPRISDLLHAATHLRIFRFSCREEAAAWLAQIS